jgi:hypothetical protein
VHKKRRGGKPLLFCRQLTLDSLFSLTFRLQVVRIFTVILLQEKRFIQDGDKECPNLTPFLFFEKFQSQIFK